MHSPAFVNAVLHISKASKSFKAMGGNDLTLRTRKQMKVRKLTKNLVKQTEFTVPYLFLWI